MRGRALASCPVAQLGEWASAVCADLVVSSSCVSLSVQAAWSSYVDAAVAADCVCCHLHAGNYPATHTHLLTTNSVLSTHPVNVVRVTCGLSPFSWHVRHKEVSGE